VSILSPELLAAVKQAEGLRTVAYRDTNGFWTIGYGHKLAAGKDWGGYAINSDTANGLLVTDLNEATLASIRLMEWPFLDTPARQDAQVELVFNMGAGRWATFTETRFAIRAHDWQGAHDGLLESLWATQVGKTRSNRLANQLLTGTYPETKEAP
jgi:lysozyme